jgi:glycosyltransferase involved in cell wall biosynthesis
MITENEVKSLKIVKVSIGLPVLNGEKFIRKKLDSLLEQTFTDFEIIISDNASTDLTPKICQEYTNKDKRIKYFRQKEKVVGAENFGFVLQKAKYKYFLWTAVDDIILPQFIEKTVKILESNQKIACSSSKMKLIGKTTTELEIKPSDSVVKKKIKKIMKNFGQMNTYSASGPYERRVKEYIKNMRHNQIFYGIFRTNQIRQSFVSNPFYGQDGCTVFNILKFGELYVINEILMEVYDGGISRNGIIELTKTWKYNLFNTIFPMYQFTKWCIKNLGCLIFVKNIDFFIKMNLIAESSLLIDIIRKIKNSD